MCDRCHTDVESLGLYLNVSLFVSVVITKIAELKDSKHWSEAEPKALLSPTDVETHVDKSNSKIMDYWLRPSQETETGIN